MVTALLRALGFDDEAEAPPGEGQDRAPVGAGQDTPPDIQAQQRAVRGAADQWIGTPYHMGGSDQKNIDCSGLVNALLRGFGARIPAGHGPATTGWRNGEMASPVAWDDIRPGDVLLSPANPRDPQAGEHMALYVGGGQMVEAAGPEGAPVRYAPVTNRNLQPYRMREPVPGLQQVTLMAQREGDLPQQAPPAASAGGGPQPGGPPTSIQRIAMQAGADPELADIMAASALTESSGNPTARRQTAREDSVGLWQANRRGGAGAGQSVEALQDPQTNARAVMTDFQTAYTQGQRQGLRGPDLAVYTHLHAERPADQAWNGDPATRMRANYAQVDAHSKQAEELHIGGTFAPAGAPGPPGPATAGGAPNPVQQAWEASAPLRQQLQAAFGGAAEAVAGLGATPAHAEAAPPAGPPPGPTPQVQPLRGPAQSPEDINRGVDAMLTPGAQAVGDVASAVGTAASAVAAPFGRSVANIGTPSQAQQAAQAARPPPPAASPPAGPAAPGTPFGQAMDQARRAAASQAAPPSTAPAAAIAETAPPTGTPGQGPAWGDTPGPTGPQPSQAAPSGLPPDTATETWDNRLRAWVPRQHPEFPGGGHFRLAPGVEAATEDVPNPAGGLGTTRPAPNPPGTPVEYVPNQAGYYDTPQGRQYFDSTTQQWHQPTGQGAQQQGTQTHDLGSGLRFVQPDPKSPNGTWLWTDPGSGVTRSAAGSLADPTPPAGLQQPTQAPMSEYQRTTSDQTRQQADVSNQQWWADYQQRVAQTDVTNSIAQQRLAQEAQQHADELALRQRQATIPTRVGGDLYGPDPNDPSQVTNLGPASQTPGEQASTAFTTAQTNRLTQEGTLPEVRGNRLYSPVTNPDTGVSSYQDTGPVPMSASEQALADERAHEFGTLSAYQQSQAEQSKASLAQNESQFQQSLAEKQAESDKPYQQMTKAEQARAGIDQQRLGLDTQRLGLDEAKAANQLEPLPRGGIMRVDPFTGQSSLINAPEPEDIRMVGSQIYIPGGRQVSMLGSQITGGPNPYAGVPTGGGGMFSYPGAQGGMGGQQANPYQNWGGPGGGGWGGQQMGGSPGWAPPQQQRQGWMGSGY